MFGVNKATFAELNLPRFAEGFLAPSSDAQKGRNFFKVCPPVLIGLKSKNSSITCIVVSIDV
jgi:hypothetical protein